MTIEKGAAWGTVAMTPFDAVVAPDEAAMARAAGAGTRHIALASGDLLRALGVSAAAAIPTKGGSSLLLPCDLLEVRLDDGDPIPVVSHVLVGSPWRPRAWITTGGFIGRRNVAPRAHPNDGMIDVLEFKADLRLRGLFAVQRRMRLGDHLPHPLLSMQRTSRYEFTAATDSAQRASAPVTMDGRAYGRARRVQVTVRPDAFTLCVANPTRG